MSAGHGVEDEARASTVVYPLSGDQDTTSLTLRVAGDHDEWLALLALIDRFVGRYTNPKTSHQYRAELTALFRHVRVTDPRLLSDPAVNQWVGLAKANNTRRNRLTRICVFLRWCVRYELADPRLVEDLQSRENPLRDTPPLYGKLQGKYPAHWLTREEAYGSLLGGCDRSDVGRRDELVLRLWAWPGCGWPRSSISASVTSTSVVIRRSSGLGRRTGPARWLSVPPCSTC